MSTGRRINRRAFMGTAAGAAGAAAAGPFSIGTAAAHGGGHHHGGPNVPRNRIGLQQWSIRDAITRLDKSVSGYLGGRDFPEDPTDLGPLVPLPGGFASVFKYLASVGYRGFEFFSFNQGPNGPITDQQLRAALDSAGMVAAGTHTGGLQQMVDPAYRQAQIDRARILGYRMIGTAGNPGPGNPRRACWSIGSAGPAKPTRSGPRCVPSGSNTSSTPSRTGSGSSTTRRIPSSAACTGSTGSPPTPTAATCSSSGTRCTRWPAGRASWTRSTAASSTSTAGTDAWPPNGG